MKLLFSIFLAAFISLLGFYPNLDDNPLLTERAKDKITPFLFPIDHPLKEVIDEIFSQERVVKSLETIKAAGFKILSIQHKSDLIVAKHEKIPGLIFKFYRDSKPNGRGNIPGWQCLRLRCKNGRKTKEFIKEHQIQYFTVPDKWLYPLPFKEKKAKNNHQSVVLIATDMELGSRKQSEYAWKKEITRQHLEELFLIFKEGYGSTHLINNIPYTQNHTFTLIDLEKPKRALDLKRTKKYFSKKMQKYWLDLIESDFQ